MEISLENFHVDIWAERVKLSSLFSNDHREYDDQLTTIKKCKLALRG